MNTLPDHSISSHRKIFFLPVIKPRRTIQTVPSEEIDFNLKDLMKNGRQNHRKISNILEIIIEKGKNANIFLYLLKNIMFPNFIAFLFNFCVIKFDNSMNFTCLGEDRLESMYLVIRNAVFNTYFYNWAVGLCLLFEEKLQKILFTIMFIGVLIVNFIVNYNRQYILLIGNFSLDVVCFTVLFQVVFYLVVKIYQRKFRKIEIFRLPIVMVLFLLCFADHYIIRQYLIKLVYVSLDNIPNNKIIFQCFLFVFYQLHGKVFKNILNRFKDKIPKNMLIYLIKYYIINVISSCTLLSVVFSEEKHIELFAIFNFCTQLFSLYSQGNIILHYFLILMNFLKPKNKQKEKKKIQKDSEINSMIAGLVNESIYIITFTILNIIIFDRTFQFSFYDYGTKKMKDFCVTSFDKLVTFIPINLFLLFAINFSYFVYMIFKMKSCEKTKFLWKTENYSLLIRIYSLVLFQGNADMNFQFYLYLNLINENAKKL